VVYIKGWDPKQKYGSVQRIVNQMHSGVPVLVEAVGIFESLVRQYHYSCAFVDPRTRRRAHGSTNNAYYPNLTHLLARVRDDYGLRQTCRQEGLQIARHYTPSVIGKATLRAAGYTGEIEDRCEWD